MPVVTQEELSNVRLRPLLGAADQSHDDVDAGGPERREACCPPKPPPPPPPQGPKARPPPVAAKPPVPRWLPGHMTETETPPPAPQTPPTGSSQGQGEVTHTKVQRPKPKRSHHHQAATSDDITQQRPANRPPGHEIDASATPAPYSQSETRGGVGNCPVTVAERVPAELQRKRVTPPPVARKPDIILRPSTNNHLTNTNTGQCLEDRGGQGSAASQMTRLSLGEPDLSPPRTEDLFTIIHRSKKKLLSGRESVVDSPGSRQTFGSPTRGGCDPHAPAQGQGQGVGGERSSSKTDSFMAFLQRRRSQKPNAGERVSAAELLKTSKHLTNHSTEPA